MAVPVNMRAALTPAEFRPKERRLKLPQGTARADLIPFFPPYGKARPAVSAYTSATTMVILSFPLASHAAWISPDGVMISWG